jgi:hypothetical protein
MDPCWEMGVGEDAACVCLAGLIGEVVKGGLMI